MGRVTWRLEQADAVEWLLSHPGALDLIITDPAYESLEKHRARGTTTRLAQSKSSSNEWFSIFPNERFVEFFAAAYAALPKNGHLYVLCDPETAFIIKPLGEFCGFKFWKPIVWDKLRMGMGYHYRARYEFVLFFEKGKRKLNDLGVPDVLGYENIHDILRAKGVRNGYPTEKPVVGLLDILVLMSSDLYERVGDPFCGSGATGEAALTLGRDFLGGDVSPYAIETSRERLTAVEAALWAASSDS